MLTRRRWLPLAAALVVGLGAGLLGGAFADQNYPEYVPSLGVHGRGQLDASTLEQAARIIQAHGYQSVSASKLTQGSVRGMVQAIGDPYTTYLDPAQYRSQQDSFAGKHTGVIGIYVTFAGNRPAVSGLVPGSPAEKAGLRTGDVITSIDGRDTTGLTAEQTAALIRGPQGTSVSLGVDRSGTALTFAVERADFSSPMVVSLLLDGDVLYMRVYQFGTQTTTEFDQQLNANLAHARSVVLDLRDNPGGYIDAATSVISRFVGDGEAYELRDRAGHVDRHDVTGAHPATGIPVVVLVNANTASAAEIVSGSLQARHRAVLVGTKTFGKGSVQVDYPLNDGGDLHLTVQHWFLPDGRNINGSGLQPDQSVTLASPQAMFDAVQPALGHAQDVQLNRALSDLGAE